MTNINGSLHEIQTKILKNLLYVRAASFSELNKEKISSDLFSFHLRQLMDLRLIAKQDSGLYVLTDKGKEYTNLYDTEQERPVLEKQGKSSVVVICLNVKGEVLVQERLKHPYFGFHGFIIGKLKWGEATHEGALRELQEEAGISADITLRGLYHEHVYGQDGVLKEDKFFHITVAENPVGEVKREFSAGRNMWLPLEELKKDQKAFYDIHDLLNFALHESVPYKEKVYKVSSF